MDAYEAFERSVGSSAALVKGLGGGQMDAPTPCTEWDVRALLNHLVGTLWLCEALLGGHAPRYAMTPGSLPSSDLVEDDPAVAYADASATVLGAASAPGALASMHRTPLGEMPGTALIGFTTLDVFVHGWDLARATGQPTDLDADLAAHVLAFARQGVTDDNRAPRIGPPIPVAAGAPVLDQLLGYLGRRP
jgi:uncharacterized protein (TIGR03086 family)